MTYALTRCSDRIVSGKRPRERSGWRADSLPREPVLSKRDGVGMQ